MRLNLNLFPVLNINRESFQKDTIHLLIRIESLLEMIKK